MRIWKSKQSDYESILSRIKGLTRYKRWMMNQEGNSMAFFDPDRRKFIKHSIIVTAIPFAPFLATARAKEESSRKSKTDDCSELAQKVVKALKDNKHFITTIESCTGGGLIDFLTDVSGSSQVVLDGFIVYSDEAKIKLGVPAEVIQKTTVYSRETSIEMAKAGIQQSVRATIGVGITGLLVNPDTRYSNLKPGTVHVAVVSRSRTSYKKYFIDESRNRKIAKEYVIELTLQQILDFLLGKPN